MSGPHASGGRRSGAAFAKYAVIGLLIAGAAAALAFTGTEKLVTAAAPPADFLASNKERAGVKSTASGLQYEVLTEGQGESPVATDTVAVHYEGKLVDGTVFDSSYQRGEPAVFRLDQVIPGWTEGVQLMKPGAKYRFTIPPELGYGPEGAGGVIPPNAVLQFDVELLAIAPRQG
ncbi:FKBP-type peptidyl-prolyl cis-trans isomerase [Sphingoaurantiacus capsulatus]|uniref:Peptidyl-prolyl cis-trans isomerase n=1 Tax=Sphingoaurantiacus capsulatus TaxID=1771310 RepID=A0ABV7X9I5_9SPHN